MEFILVGIATFFNLAIIKWKLEKHRYEDAILDFTILFSLAYAFQGSYGGLVVATISSAMMSLYFIASPPKFVKGLIEKFKTEFHDPPPPRKY